ncbi:SHOCT domain-containing protein [Kitasatospora albolonga]|uniref:SHOCT domain-containing protein n=1 Tax=Kitasatospora albolonga TaxID=68173 RepID=UPI0031EA2FAC
MVADSTATRSSTPAPAHHTAPPDPEQLLAERYAKGEIDTDEYRHRLETLLRSSAPVPAPSAR